ncbi:nuclear autoantigen Sp-100-like [Lacerta agilis]|uniref:nuclear autoantigen Sp-100-like n=1 Tax=Lacerta agilis TaxID=80427 RepID=UPI001419DCF1|nr:nuclear autoantigen Sp-100-like [Lacerta agilis]
MLTPYGMPHMCSPYGLLLVRSGHTGCRSHAAANWLDKVTANPNDICKVVYGVLESIETNVSAIEEIFCKENLEAYPNLQPLYESLENGKGMQNNKIQDLNVVVRRLKVRCGRSKGVLYKSRFTAGVSRKSIKDSNGKWFTPLEFKDKGRYKSSKCWRRCIHYGEISLEELIKWGEILKPQPESSRMQKPDDLCAVSCEERRH